jgi:PKD repeat protein
MKRINRIVGFLALLTLWLVCWAPAALASSWAPLQNVQAYQEGLYVHYRVYDPKLDQWRESETPTGGATVFSLTNINGVVSWYSGLYVHYAVYDAIRGYWVKSETPTGGSTVYSLTSTQGVIAWNSGLYIHYVNYDAQRGSWVKSETPTGGSTVYSLTNAQGVIAWNSGLYVHYVIYDAQRGSWVKSETPTGGLTVTNLTVQDATVSWQTTFNYYTKGYKPSNGTWYDGVTQPQACFVASPTSGNPSLWVWFWDMSVGAFYWSWTFGDGNSSILRSPYYLYSGAGVYTATLTVTGAGGISSSTTTITTDLTGPTGTVSINGGAAYTNQLAVTLNLNATDNSGAVAQMSFSSDNSTWSGWEPYALTRVWTLSDGDGEKWVYARFQDGAGNVSATGSDSIVVDTTGPVNCSVAVNSGAAYTNTPMVTLNLAATDLGGEVTHMRFQNEATGWSVWEPFAATKDWVLTGNEGEKTVSAQFKDGGGNVSDPVSDTIVLDATGPTSCSVIINGGAPYTNSLEVNLGLAATDPNGAPLEMSCSNDNITWSDWEPYAPTKAWTLSPSDGTRWVFARFRDAANNNSTPVIDSLVLDRVPPTDGSLAAVMGLSRINLAWGGFNDDRSGIRTYMLYVSTTGYPDPGTGTKIYDGLATTFTHYGVLPGRTYYYRLCAVDNAGNVSFGATASVAPEVKSMPFLMLLLGD